SLADDRQKSRKEPMPRRENQVRCAKKAGPVAIARDPLFCMTDQKASHANSCRQVTVPSKGYFLNFPRGIPSVVPSDTGQLFGKQATLDEALRVTLQPVNSQELVQLPDYASGCDSQPILVVANAFQR